MSDWHTIANFAKNQKKLDNLGIQTKIDGLSALIQYQGKKIHLSSPEEFNGFVMGIEFMKGEFERGQR